MVLQSALFAPAFAARTEEAPRGVVDRDSRIDKLFTPARRREQIRNASKDLGLVGVDKVVMRKPETESPEAMVPIPVADKLPRMRDLPVVSPAAILAKATNQSNRPKNLFSLKAPPAISLPTKRKVSGSAKFLPVAWVNSGLASNTVPGPSSVAELARSLKYNPDLIFEFVHDNIDYVPVFGVQRGAFGCLLDGAGTDFDQSQLMVELLRESGFEAYYELGIIEFDAADLANWLNISTNDWHTFQNLMANGGIPVEEIIFNSSNSDLISAQIYHMFVHVEIGGTDYVFDPSFKLYTYTSGINLGTATGYNQASFLSAAQSGATVTPDIVENLNSANARSELASYATNLVDWIRANQPAASLSNIVGGKKVNHLTGRQRETSLPNLIATYDVYPDDIPDFFRVILEVQYLNIEAAPGVPGRSFFADEIYGRRLTVFYDVSNQPYLLLDGVLQAFPGDPAGAQNTLTVTIYHPYVGADQTFSSVTLSTAPFLIGHTYGTCSRSMVEYHRELLMQASLEGASDFDESVFGEALAIEWYTHEAEAAMSNGLIDQLNRCTSVVHHQSGITSYIGTPSFDIPGAVIVSSSRDVSDTSIKPVVCLLNIALHNSALEAAAHKQLHDANAVSTPVALDAANTAGMVIYDIGSTAEWDSIAPLLTNYSTSLKANIRNAIAAGHRALIPEDGHISIDDWTSYSFFLLGTGANFGVLGTVIGSVAMAGGQCTVATGMDNRGKQAKPKKCPCPCKDITPTSPPRMGSPVDLFYGSYILHQDDLSVGSGDFPYELTFQRMYDSSMRYMNGPLGRGWMHNFDWSVYADSDGYQAMGEDSPIDAAAAITEIFVTNDLLFDSALPLNKFIIAALSASWYVDQTSNNTVVISTSDGTKTFVKLADGTFNPPPGDASTLTISGGLYKYETPQRIASNFNSAGGLASKVYPSGAQVDLTYTSGKLTSISNNTGRTLTLGYTDEKLTSVSDGTGRSVSFEFDSDDNLVTFTNPADKDTTYEYISPGELEKYFLPANPSAAMTTNFYDSLGRIASQLDPFSHRTTYLIAGSRTEEIDPLNNSRIVYFDEIGDIVRDIDALQNETKYEYDGLYRQVLVTLPEGNSFATTWDFETTVSDIHNNLVRVQSNPKPSSGLSPISTSFTYEPLFNKVASLTDGNNNTTSFEYDATTGNLLTVERPTVASQVPTIAFTWNSKGQPLSMTDETGIVTSLEYSATNETLLSIVQDSGTGGLALTSEFTYTAAGDIASATDPNTNTYSFQFDDLRRRTQTEAPSPFNFLTEFDYDDNDNLLAIRRQTGDPASPWQTYSFTYSATNQLLSSADPLSNETRYSFDAKDRVQTVTDPEARTYRLSYDPLDRVSAIADPTGVISERRSYTPNGNLSVLVDAKGNRTSFTFDGLDRPDKKIYADSSFEQVAGYDNNNNILSYTTSGGNSIEQTFDALNRVVTYSPQGQPTVTLSYDLHDRLLSAATPVVSGDPTSGAITFDHDSAGRLISEEHPDGKTVLHDLDANGNRTKMTYPDGYFVDYTFDALDRLTDIKLNGATASAVHYDFDKLSRRTATLYANGARALYSYAPNDDLTALAHIFSATAKVAFAYQQNKAHEITGVSVSDKKFLAPASAEATQAYTGINNLNQYTSIDGEPLSHDGNGNMVDFDDSTFNFNTENQLTKVARGSTTTDIRYDALGRRASIDESGGPSVRRLFSGLRNIADYDSASGDLMARHIFGPTFDQPVATIRIATADLRFIHLNNINSTIAETDSSGALQAKLAYLPFGAAQIEGSPGGFGFAGMSHHAPSGLNLTLYRAYDSRIGRWLSRDPMGESVGINLYAYIFNSPLALVDPLGLAPPPKQAMAKIVELLEGLGAKQQSDQNHYETGVSWTVDGAGNVMNVLHGTGISKNDVQIPSNRLTTDRGEEHSTLTGRAMADFRDIDATPRIDVKKTIDAHGRLWVRLGKHSYRLYDASDCDPKKPVVKRYDVNYIPPRPADAFGPGRPGYTNFSSPTEVQLRDIKLY